MSSILARSLASAPFAGASPQPDAWLKRGLDLTLAAAMLVVFLPLIGLIWLAVRTTSRGPALFVQERVGRYGRPFGAYKFRTMVVDAEAALASHLAQDPAAAAEYRTYKKLRRDPRVTLIGRFLRQYSLDELPQLFNVLKGEMSLVGPRCYLPGEIPDMAGRESVILRVLPGITGLWQVSGRSRTTFAERVAIDVDYVRNRSIGLDLAILGRTMGAVLAGRDAY